MFGSRYAGYERLVGDDDEDYGHSTTQSQQSWTVPVLGLVAVTVLVAGILVVPQVGRVVGLSMYKAGDWLQNDDEKDSSSQCSCNCETSGGGEPVPTASPTITRNWALYWTDGSTESPEQSYVWTTDALDAGFLASVLIPTGRKAEGIDIDTNATTLYYDAEDGCVRKIDISGYAEKIIVCYENATGTSMQGLSIYDYLDAIFWVDKRTGELYRTALYNNDGTYSVVYSGFDEPVDVAVDKRAVKLYVTTATGLYQLDARDGGDAQLLLESSAELAQFRGVAVDSVKRYVYFAADSTIYKAPISDPSSYSALITGLSKPVGLAVDGAQSFLFYTSKNGVYAATTSGFIIEEVANVLESRFITVHSVPAPTPAPTALPTPVPTSLPTEPPTSLPTSTPTLPPSPLPTSTPTSVPVPVPTRLPTSVPTMMPTPLPTSLPTSTPTTAPTMHPTSEPTSSPSTLPTSIPTADPTPIPTSVPTSVCFKSMVECGFCDGLDGRACAAPTSPPSPALAPPLPAPTTSCTDRSEWRYRVVLYDSNGKGWGQCNYDLYHVLFGGKLDGVVRAGSLKNGFSKTTYSCLKNGCYEFYIAPCDKTRSIWLEIFDTTDNYYIDSGETGELYFCTYDGAIYNGPTPAPVPEPQTRIHEAQCTESTYMSSEGFAYCYVDRNLAYDDAVSSCASLGLSLVQLDSAREAHAVNALASSDFTWLNLNCDWANATCQTSLRGWRWANGRLLSQSYSAMTIAGNETVYGGGRDKFCARWWQSGFWAPAACAADRYGALCEYSTSLVDSPVAINT